MANKIVHTIIEKKNVKLSVIQTCIGIRYKQKKARFSSDLFEALQVGLEPTTYGLTVRRSNQLSY